jgi:hypothetical protein
MQGDLDLVLEVQVGPRQHAQQPSEIFGQLGPQHRVRHQIVKQIVTSRS